MPIWYALLVAGRGARQVALAVDLAAAGATVSVGSIGFGDGGRPSSSRVRAGSVSSTHADPEPLRFLLRDGLAVDVLLEHDVEALAEPRLAARA